MKIVKLFDVSLSVEVEADNETHAFARAREAIREIAESEDHFADLALIDDSYDGMDLADMDEDEEELDMAQEEFDEDDDDGEE